MAWPLPLVVARPLEEETDPAAGAAAAANADPEGRPPAIHQQPVPVDLRARPAGGRRAGDHADPRASARRGALAFEVLDPAVGGAPVGRIGPGGEAVEEE